MSCDDVTRLVVFMMELTTQEERDKQFCAG